MTRKWIKEAKEHIAHERARIRVGKFDPNTTRVHTNVNEAWTLTLEYERVPEGPSERHILVAKHTHGTTCKWWVFDIRHDGTTKYAYGDAWRD